MNKEQTVQTISVAQLKEHYDHDTNFCLIDVRELSEWQDIHIPKAVHISKDNLKESIANTVTEQNMPIYLHCRSGVRSLHAASALQELGYTNVFSVDGGIMAWSDAGFPTESIIDDQHQ